MSEDLHDIDDLFRGGLEGHEEELPSSVWEAVNNDLDQKQASYYKSKYKRLKKAALLLLLLCFLGGTYVIFDVWHHGQKPITNSHARKDISSAAPSAESKKENSFSTDKLNRIEKSAEQKLKSDTAYDQPSSFPSESILAKEKGAKTDDKLTRQSRNNQPLLSTIPARVSSNKNDPNFQQGNVAQNQKSSFSSPVNNQSTFQRDQPLARTGISDFLRQFSLSDNRLSLSAISVDALSHKPIDIIPSTKTKKNSNSAHSFSLSAFAAPNFSFDRLEDDDHLAGPGQNRQEAHRNEQDNISFSGGLLLNYALSQKLSLQSGLTVTASSTSIAPKTVYAKADNNGHTHYELNCSSGYVYISPKGTAQPTVGDSAATSGTTTRLTYVGVPAIASYHINAGRFSLTPSIGAGLNFLISGKTKTNLSKAATTESSTTDISGLKPTYLDGHIGVGIEYKVGKNLSIGIRPNARLAITPINKETPVKSYQNFLSVETGVRIKL